MLYDGLSLAEGTAVSNLTIASGTSNPASPTTGELFYRTDSPNEGLYVYTGTEWQAVGSGNVSFDSLNVKPAVRAATTANITLSGTQTVDGVSLIAGDRVLVKNQNTGSQNGIYVVASGSWARSTDFDGSPSTEVKAGDFTFVTEGTTNADTGWVLATNGTITIGTTALTFAQFSSGTISLTSTYVGFGSGSNLLTGSSKFTWNDTTRVLTLGGGSTTLIGSGGTMTVAGAADSGDLVVKGGRSTGSVPGGNLYIQGGDSLNVGDGGNNTGPTLYLRTGSGGGAYPYPGAIVFQSHNIGSVPISWVERMRMLGSGALSFGTSGTAYGTAGQVLTSNGDASPSWQNAPVSTFDGGTVANATTFSSSVTLSSSLIFGTLYTETNTNVTATATTTINCSLGNNFALTLGTSISTLTLTNVPTSGRVYNMSLVILQSGAGSNTITWPGSVKWPSGGAPALTSTAGKYDIITLMTYDGGTNWFGFVAGQNY